MNPINYFSIKLNNYKSLKYLKLYFTILVGNAEMYLYSDKTHKYDVEYEYDYSYIHRKEIFEMNKNIRENYYLIIKCSEPSFIQLKYETNENYKGYKDLIPNEINIEPIIPNVNSYYNLYNPNYYYPFENEKRNNDFYYKLVTMDCSMIWSNVDQSYNNLTEFNFEMEKNKLYYYLTTYGFYSKVDNFHHTTFNNENCGLIIYNGEKSINRPLLVISDMPHISKNNEASYIYPIIYDENNDQGILIEFKLFGDTSSSYSTLYQITYFLSGDSNINTTYLYNNYTTLYLNSDFYKNYLKNNSFGILNVQIKKLVPNNNFYISTNFMSSKISPEYISLNQTYALSLRKNSSKYFYSQISKNKNGYIKLNSLDTSSQNNIDVYAKIVKKNEVEKNYNWNKRVKLPEKDDENLLPINNYLIYYDETQTQKCEQGCEIYFHIKNLKDGETFLYFTINEGEYKEDPDKTDDKDKDKENEQNNNLWLKIMIPSLIVFVIVVIVVVVVILAKKKKYAEISKDKINEINESEGLLQN